MRKCERKQHLELKNPFISVLLVALYKKCNAVVSPYGSPEFIINI